MASASNAPVTSTPAPSIVLLKERNAKQAEGDAYEIAFTRASFRVSFLPPLSFEFDSAALRPVAEWIARCTPAQAGVAALVATSPRGVEAMMRAINEAEQMAHEAHATASGADAAARFSAWASLPFFVVSRESGRRLDANPVAVRLGFRATVFPGVTNAAQLGEAIRQWWADSPSPRAGSLLAIVGDRRRDEMFLALAANQSAVVPVREVVAYRTVCAKPASAESASAAAAASPAAASPASGPSAATFASQLLFVLSHAGDETYVVFFSPSGVETWFEQLQAREQVLREERRHLRFCDKNDAPLGVEKAEAWGRRLRYAAIGQTSAAAFRSHFSASSLVPPPPLLVSEKPNADALLACIIAARSQEARISSPLRPLRRVPFYKYHATLNDYVLLDGFDTQYTRSQLVHLARELCADRRGAVGSDGLLYATIGREYSVDELAADPTKHDPAKGHIHGRMYMFNTDGSEAEMCGNGLRCVVKFVHDHKYFGLAQSTLCLLTGAGEKLARITRDENGLAATVALDLGQPLLAATEHRCKPAAGSADFRCHDVSMGNPHCIVELDRNDPAQAIQSLDVPVLGNALHDSPRYAGTHGANVSFVDVVPGVSSSAPFADASPLSPASAALPFALSVAIRTYERGNGETWACGTGIAACVSSLLSRRLATDGVARAEGEEYDERARVSVRGGNLVVTCRMRNRSAAHAESILKRDVVHVELCGPATEVFAGSVAMSLAP